MPTCELRKFGAVSIMKLLEKAFADIGVKYIILNPIENDSLILQVMSVTH